MLVSLYANTYVNRLYNKIKDDPDLRAMQITSPISNFKYVDLERDELKAEWTGENLTRIYSQALKEEYGDLLFSVIMLGKSLNLDPNQWLLRTARKVAARAQLAKLMPFHWAWTHKWDAAKKKLEARR